MTKEKITNEQIRECLGKGMTQVAIAKHYGIAPQTLNNRIKRMRQKGLLDASETKNKKSGRLPIQRMDTVVRRSDRIWFRVTDVNEKSAVLRSLTTDDYGHQAKETVTVELENLEKDFEKKEFPEVRCYIDPNLAAENKKEAVEPEQVKEDTEQEPEMEPEAEQAADEEVGKIYETEQEHIQKEAENYGSTKERQIKRLKCEVCDTEFEAKKENRYTGIKRNMFGADALYDCFDCPNCGAQIATHERLECM